MNWFHTRIAIVMLALWAPVQSHCLLERAHLLPATMHCGQDGSMDSEGASHDPCSEKPCCELKDPTYKLSDGRAMVVPPTTAGLVRFSLLEDDFFRLGLPADSLAGALPELAVTWQFQLRTALPPRPPSLVS